jgi:hypothetical protein
MCPLWCFYPECYLPKQNKVKLAPLSEWEPLVTMIFEGLEIEWVFFQFLYMSKVILNGYSSISIRCSKVANLKLLMCLLYVIVSNMSFISDLISRLDLLQ